MIRPLKYIIQQGEVYIVVHDHESKISLLEEPGTKHCIEKGNKKQRFQTIGKLSGIYLNKAESFFNNIVQIAD